MVTVCMNRMLDAAELSLLGSSVAISSLSISRSWWPGPSSAMLGLGLTARGSVLAVMVAVTHPLIDWSSPDVVIAYFFILNRRVVLPRRAEDGFDVSPPVWARPYPP